MIDLTKVEFAEKQIPELNTTEIHGWLQLHYCVNVQSQFAAEGRPHAEKEIRLGIRHLAFGELLNPLSEITSYALKNVPPPEYMRVHELAQKIQMLLSPNPFAEHPGREAVPTEREIYWLAVNSVLQKLDYETALTIVQIIIGKTGPVPDAIGDTIRNLLAAKLNEEKK